MTGVGKGHQHVFLMLIEYVFLIIYSEAAISEFKRNDIVVECMLCIYIR